MDKTEINEEVKELHEELFLRDRGRISAEYGDENFFGKVMGMRPGDVLAFLYAIERTFNITVPSTELISGRFNCLNNVADIVYKVLSGQ